jgi:glutamine amidotransferase
MKLAIIESGGANFLSVTTAFERLGVEYELTRDAMTIQASDAVILPGVGFAGFAMDRLRADGLVPIIQNLKQPLLGICLGMQILYDFSEEGDVECLGIIHGKISKFRSYDDLIVPHMGWNNLQKHTENPIVSGVDKNDVYFVHSYYAPINEATIATTHYGFDFTAIAKHNNFYGMQFHPEKSGAVGHKLLKNFLQLIRQGT